MATIREYFDNDAKEMAVSKPWTFEASDGSWQTEVIAKILYAFQANAKYWFFYIPPQVNLSACLSALFHLELVQKCSLSADGDGCIMGSSFMDYSEVESSETFVFTKKVHLYLDHDLTKDQRKSLVDQARILGYVLAIHDREYAALRSSAEKPLAFVSHDSRDKDPFVKELVHELIKHSCLVWYDEFSLKVGDSLRASIEKGLRESKKCILILSPNFFANKGWGQTEYDSVFTREIIEKRNVILPVWLNVEAQDVYQYSPKLADRVGLPSALGTEEIARRLANAVKAHD